MISENWFEEEECWKILFQRIFVAWKWMSCHYEVFFGLAMMRQYWFVSHHKNFPVILSFHLAHQPWVIKIDRTLRLNDLTDVNFPNPDLMNGSDFLDHEFPKHMPDRRVECRTPAVASVKGARTATRQGGKRVSQIGAESRTRKLASR